MKSLILKTTTLALGAFLVFATAGADSAEARGRHGFHGGHHHNFHGHGHRHHFHRHHFHRSYFSNCFWKHGRRVCFY